MVMVADDPQRDTITPHMLLPQRHVHIWRARLDVSTSRLEILQELLSPDENARAQRFHFKRDCRDYIVGRGVLREILGSYLDMDPSHVSFTYNDYGKPDLLYTPGSDMIRFNMSHSGRMVIYALSCGREIGVDIEHIRPMTSAEGIIERYCSGREKLAFRSVPQSLKLAAFFNCWTRKEAYIKARGEGLSRPLDKFSVSLAPGEPAAFLSSEEIPFWSLKDVDVGDEYVAAVVFEGHELPISNRVWSWYS